MSYMFPYDHDTIAEAGCQHCRAATSETPGLHGRQGEEFTPVEIRRSSWHSRSGQITAPRILDRHRQAEGMAPAIRFLAHGLGLSLHEEPVIAAHTHTLLQKQ
jgi:hypothetical protein